ncbi:Hypothetical protein POVN_LOCUS375 [uncultured virus]|nr:Hypothetical protein POVN_LOCUS375 [uncultured virus]
MGSPKYEVKMDSGVKRRLSSKEVIKVWDYLLTYWDMFNRASQLVFILEYDASVRKWKPGITGVESWAGSDGKEVGGLYFRSAYFTGFDEAIGDDFVRVVGWSNYKARVLHRDTHLIQLVLFRPP